MNAPTLPPLASQYPANTHEVINVSTELTNYNVYEQDVALKEAVQREGAAWAHADLSAFGAKLGQADYLELGALANKFGPELDTHDRFGNRVDLVRFHPAYHQLMKTSIEHGLHSSPWTDPKPGAQVARAAHTYLHTQVEAGHGCPITMTFAAVPSLRTTPALAAYWEPKITARVYDPRNVPDAQKAGVTIGMAMTEKQGGSDVRANTTQAYPVGQSGPGQLYELVGHKYFVSAPMCDAFLVLAQTPGGLSCFLLPRWRTDGSKNPMQVLRLKRKMGNVSNASSETELRGAHAWMVGEEGRGVRTIIEMVAMTRFDCMIGSSAGQRAALSHALHHCSVRSAFGKVLNQQPLMQNVLADMALETEGALALTMRIGRALDNRSDTHEDLLVRLGTAVGKYWICKRTPNHAYEAMECIGGSGVMEDSPFPRLLRESPINAIWEGSGNVQCLDVLRAMQKTPAVVEAYFAEVAKARGANALLDQYVRALQGEFKDLSDLEYRARDVVDRMAIALQAALLVQHGNAAVADGFCASRLAANGHHNYGALPRGWTARRSLRDQRHGLDGGAGGTVVQLFLPRSDRFAPTSARPATMRRSTDRIRQRSNALLVAPGSSYASGETTAYWPPRPGFRTWRWASAPLRQPPTVRGTLRPGALRQDGQGFDNGLGFHIWMVVESTESAKRGSPDFAALHCVQENVAS